MPNVMSVCNPGSGRTEAPIASPARSPDTCFPASSIRLSPAFLIPLSDSEALMRMPGSSLRSQLRPSQPPTPGWIRWYSAFLAKSVCGGASSQASTCLQLGCHLESQSVNRPARQVISLLVSSFIVRFSAPRTVLHRGTNNHT